MNYERSRRAPDAAIEGSGTIAEADAFGTIDTADPEYRRRATQWYEKSAELVQKFTERRLSERERNALFASSFHLIENLPEYRNNPGRATNPDHQILRDIRLAVAEGLELVTEADLERVKIFTAIGSPIDKHLGIDGFIRVDAADPYHPPVYVSFDYTINRNKDKTRADVLIRALPDPDLAEEAYIKATDAVGRDLVLQYRRKLELRKLQPRR